MTSNSAHLPKAVLISTSSMTRRLGAFAVLAVFLLQNFVFLLPVNAAVSATPSFKVAAETIERGPFLSPDIVVSQVYGGGGNSGATYTNDFVELFNRGTSTVNITGWSVQYASSTGTTWQVTALSGSVAPGQYYLVQQAAGAGGTTPLPTPDATGSIAMSGTNGKIALSSTSTALSGSCPTGLIDLVGYGTANCFEGTAATPALSNTTAAIRAGNGCTETDQNSTDFATGAPIPRNTSSPTATCTAGPTNPTGVGAANPSTVDPGNNTLLTVTVTPGTMPASTGIAVTGDLTSIGGSATQTFFDDGSNGDVTGGDNIFSYNATVGAMTTGGAKVLATSISDAQMRTGSANINLTVNAPVPPANNVTISQVYGGGGNSGATYLNDFVELYNPTMSTVNLSGWSVQYSSATGTVWSGVQPIGGTIGPGEYYLISLATGGANGAPLPAANILGDVNMSATTGKVALVNTPGALPDGCPMANGNLVDLVGYGTANCSEGAGLAPAPSNTTAILRKSNGAQDTNDNAADFLTGAPNPRRTAPIVEIGPSVLFTDPSNNNTIAPRDASMTITFTEPVTVDPNWFDISCATTGQHNSATEAGNSRVYVITPNVNFLAGEVCTVTIFKNSVHDQDTDDSEPNTDTLPADYVWSFTVATGTPPPYTSDVHLTMGNPSGAAADINQPNNYLMVKPELTLSYDRDRGIPNWVSWHLATEWTGSLVRIDTFRPDPAVPPAWYRVQATDYSGSGFDRGHMTPNADRDPETSRPINQATFLMTNMVPQAPDNNQGPWAVMENDLRALMTTNEIYVVSGGAGTGGIGSASGNVINTVGGGNVAVPGYTWKAALILPIGTDDLSRVDNNTRIIAVIMPNIQGIRTDPWQKYLSTVDQIEAMTGYDLFSNVSLTIQNVIESRLDAASNTSPQTVPGGLYTDLNITGPKTTLTGNITVNGNLTLGGSHLITGNFKITLGPNATVTRLGGYIIGNVEKQFTNPVFGDSGVPAIGNFVFPVGTANGYSPVTANVTALNISPSSLTVSAVQAAHPNTPMGSTSMLRYWTLTESGDLTADLTFNYSEFDRVIGVPENSYLLQRYNGAFTQIPAVIDTTANTATAVGISEFSDWALIAPLVPTGAHVSVEGRVLSVDGKAVFGAAVSMIDSNGIVYTTRTNPFGHFRFYDVPAGGTFVFDASHKLHRFRPQGLSVLGDVDGLIIRAIP